MMDEMSSPSASISTFSSSDSLSSSGVESNDSSCSLTPAQSRHIDDTQRTNVLQSDQNYSGEESSSLLMTNKRKYTFVNRTPKKPNSTSRNKRWITELTSMTKPKLSRKKCCKKLKCYARVDYDFFMEQAHHLFSVSKATRRTILQSFLGSGKKFHFNGQQVCVFFLKTAFHFSSELLTQVLNSSSIDTAPSASTELTLNVVDHFSNNRRQQSSFASKANLFRRKKEAIASFLFRLSENCGDFMPNKNEVHLPFHQRKELYSIFVGEFTKLYPTVTAPSRQYFRQVWKKDCPKLKVMRSQRFSICEECDRIRIALRETIVRGGCTDAVKSQREKHLKFIFRERLEYQMKKDQARLNSSKVCSIIIDGADESAFGLPHMTTKTKSQRGYTMKVKVVGLLEHRIENKITLFTMTEEHATGANHIVEVIHRMINSKRREGPLPRKFYVQLDNCCRENKNRYLLSFLEMMVSLGVFDSVEVGFLPVGHTHEDVDQVFSQTSARLRVHDAITLQDLQYELRQTNKGNVEIQHLKRLVNWSKLCDTENCLRKIDRVTQWRYFLFTKDPACTHTVDVKPLLTKCFVKKQAVDQWQDMFKSDIGTNPRGILRYCPDLRKTPPLQIDCPDGKEQVTKRLISEEGRINNTEKMIELYELRDHIFSARTDAFHWNLDQSVETEACGMYLNGRVNSQILTSNFTVDEIDEDMHQTASSQVTAAPRTQSACRENLIIAEPVSRQSYELGSFVIVHHNAPSNSNDRNIWVAQVVQVEHMENSEYAKKLKVHWFDRTAASEDGRDILQASFHPCYTPSPKSRKISKDSLTTRQYFNEPWCDVIDTDTVLVSFPSLTKRRCLPIAVQNKIAR